MDRRRPHYLRRLFALDRRGRGVTAAPHRHARQRAGALAGRHVATRLTANGSRTSQIELVEIVVARRSRHRRAARRRRGHRVLHRVARAALVAGEVDVAVHSYKDLPVESTPGLVVAAVPPRGPVEDVLCARDGLTLATLPPGARIGTCSARRTAQVRMLRPDLESCRCAATCRRASRASTAAISTRSCWRGPGSMRLGLDAAHHRGVPSDRMLPAPAQGAMAMQCRAARARSDRAARGARHAATRRAVDAERAMLHALGGGCSVPVGAMAHVDRRRHSP